MSEDKLRECPFCGAHAKYDPLEGEWASCANMECDMHSSSVNFSTWNARHDDLRQQLAARLGCAVEAVTVENLGVLFDTFPRLIAVITTRENISRNNFETLIDEEVGRLISALAPFKREVG